MFHDLFDIIKEYIQRLLASRLFAMAVFFTAMFCILVSRLFYLQIIEGEAYQSSYMAKTEKTVSLAGTRGNIYDRKGNLLAYNQLAYSVTIQDVGAYTRNQDRNTMLYRLVVLLNEHGAQVEGRFEVAINQDGEMVFTNTDEGAKKRFLRDFYNLKSTNDLTGSSGDYPETITAREAFEKKKSLYEIDKLQDDSGAPLDVPDHIALQMINIRYTMSFTLYQKYETTTIASYVSDETMTAILEHSGDFKGVSVEESTIRVYNNSIYFAPIIGYTGKVPEDQLDSLREKNPDYNLNDIVGRTGIEKNMEDYLQGKKGSRTMYVDSMGRIMEITQETEPQAGNSIYLTIDQDLQIGVYKLIEQQLAGVLLANLVNEDVDLSAVTDSSKIPIPVKKAYYQLINNNVLSMSSFQDEDAADIEKLIYQKYLSAKTDIMARMRSELESIHPTPMQNLPEDMNDYMRYVYSFLCDSSIIQRDKIDSASDAAVRWKDGANSLREYIYEGIANSWVDTANLNIDAKYSNADDIYHTIVEYVMENLDTDMKFSKLMYRYLVDQGIITGRELCMALYAQGVLVYNQDEYEALASNGEDYAYTFIRSKISSLELTPAQLALDPCTGSCVITSVHTGEVLALVTYPSYDNNRFSGSVDGVYFSQLQEDNSLPLWNNATQVMKAPGSTFKPITAIAGLEEKAIGLNETIECTGIYEEVEPPIRCWIYPGYHGHLDIIGGLQNSCNYFFSELARRLATDENGVYSTTRGVEVIQKYAKMFGLDHTSGIEIDESEPQITDEAPERSAMGQGTHSYSNVQLARYVAALANRGTVFELSLLDKRTDAEGNLLEDYTPEVFKQIDISNESWFAVHTGMREVIANGSAKAIFKDLEVEIAGKTGTAQESKIRPNHAFFISFAPYANPEIGVTVNIPYGYSSAHAATIAKNVYRLYYKYTNLDYIMNTGALNVSNVSIQD